MCKYYSNVLKSAKEIDDWLRIFERDCTEIVGYASINDHIVITVKVSKIKNGMEA